MGLQITEQPGVEPVTLELAKSHLRVTHDVEDELLRQYLKSARKWVEEYTRRAIISQDWTLTIDDFPRDCIALPLGRCLAVNSITYYDSAGAQQTLGGPTTSPAGTDYQEDLSSDEGARIEPAIGSSWPSAETERLAAVQVDFTAGYGIQGADVPDSLITAILYRLTDLYEFRGEYDGNGTQGAKQHASPYRLVKW